MKTILMYCILFSLLTGSGINAQTSASNYPEKYGKTLNLGLGIAYYGYLNNNIPVLHADFEFDIARNLTIAPSVSFYTYQNHYYWGGPKNPYRNYNYRQLVIPVGAKVSYYFDELFKAGPKWDFYAAGSLGVAFRKTTWENDYYGDAVMDHSTSGLYLDAHFGAELHLSQRVGMFLDLSTGVSTFGFAIHM